MKYKIKIDVVSDVVCPWCYIGKRRLEKAMGTVADQFEFEIAYHPFELNPDIPLGGTGHKEFLITKFGSQDHYDLLTNKVTNVAKQEGLTFNYELQAVAPNTRRLHALIRIAGRSGKQAQMAEVLFREYFTEGTDLSNNENIVNAALKAGLSEDEALAGLSDTQLLSEIRNEELELGKLGISGVPFYIINDKYGVSGAQSPEMLVKAFKEISNYPLLMGEVCSTDRKDC